MKSNEMIEGISNIRLFVSDFKRAIDFYRDVLGFTVAGSDDHQWALFELSNVGLLVEGVERDEEEFNALVGRFSGVSFNTANIHETYERLKERGVRFQGPPERQFWGGCLAHFQDPDGNVLTLAESKSG